MQVLIVDDEPYMVDYLRKLVDWEQWNNMDLSMSIRRAEALWQEIC